MKAKVVRGDERDLDKSSLIEVVITNPVVPGNEVAGEHLVLNVRTQS
jgi:hypothetical protein